MAIPILGDILKTVGGLAEKFIKDKDAIEKFNFEIKKIEADLALAQINLNAEDAKGSWFQSSWRPLCGYVCVFGLAVNFLISPMAAGFGIIIPQADLSVMMPLLCGLLGLGGLRTFEKINVKGN